LRRPGGFGLIIFVVDVLRSVVVCGNAINRGASGCPAVHAAALVGPRFVVGREIRIESVLYLMEYFEPGSTAFDAEVLVEERLWRRSTMPLDWGSAHASCDAQCLRVGGKVRRDGVLTACLGLPKSCREIGGEFEQAELPCSSVVMSFPFEADWLCATPS